MNTKSANVYGLPWLSEQVDCGYGHMVVRGSLLDKTHRCDDMIAGAERGEKLIKKMMDNDGQFQVEKQSYSACPWRVLDTTGAQIYRSEIFDHPHMGRIAIAGPVCFDRKRDAVAWVAAQANK